MTEPTPPVGIPNGAPVTMAPDEFARIVERLQAAGLAKRTYLLRQPGLSLTKAGRAMAALTDPKRGT